jgi:hypothetical protein
MNECQLPTIGKQARRHLGMLTFQYKLLTLNSGDRYVGVMIASPLTLSRWQTLLKPKIQDEE